MVRQLRILVAFAEGPGLAARIHYSHYSVHVSNLFSVHTAFVQSVQGSFCAAQKHTSSATLWPQSVKNKQIWNTCCRGYIMNDHLSKKPLFRYINICLSKRTF